MDVFDEDILSLWRCLQQSQVRYIMIGGFATNLHGFSRATNDIDIWIEDNLPNRKNLRKALKDQGSGDYDVIETMDFIPGWTDFQLNMGFKLDIMTRVKGLEHIGFEECYKYSVVAEIEGVEVRFLHYNHLITCKKAAGRTKDLLDVEELEKIHQASKDK
ncbi:MAG: hypothetical protein JST86_08385 [Bacteroidetes bacterium]|nr:hypothetical protein [Bacteroidota bacterium]